MVWYDYRVKRTRLMKAFFKLNITDSVGMADYYADMVEKGVKLAQIAAAVASLGGGRKI